LIRITIYLFSEFESLKETLAYTRFRMLALTSATGKLGGAVLNAVLDNKLIDPKELVVCVRLPYIQLEVFVANRNHRHQATPTPTASPLSAPNPSPSARPTSTTPNP
jgi:hypothetical protein